MASLGGKIKKKNGTQEVELYSLQGCIRIKNQKYILEDGSCTDYLQLCNESCFHHYSGGLCEMIEAWSDDLSYEKVSQLHDLSKPLPLVAITDGARSIRLVLQSIFGTSVCIILDWYHLQLKVKNLMSMIAYNKADKEQAIVDLKELLWSGNATEAMIYLDNMDKVKNEVKRKELRDYLEKHQKEIINYGLRQSTHKTIGSGRCEKANDLVVAHRQ
jgi:hypothetical protein